MRNLTTLFGEAPGASPQAILLGRCLHKVLVLVNNCSSYFVAMAWLRAVYNTIGGFKPLSGDSQFSGFQIVWAWVTTLLLTLVVLTIVKWLVKEKLESAESSKNSDSTLNKLSCLAWATAFDFAASAGTYAVMFSFALTLLGCFDTSTSVRLWFWVAATTVVCSALIAAGQRGYGPFSMINKISDEQQREALQFLLTFNMGFVLAFVWEYALEKQFSWFLPNYEWYTWERWVFCVTVLVVCVALLSVAHWVQLRKRLQPDKGINSSLPSSVSSPPGVAHDTAAPLLLKMTSFVAPVGQLSLQLNLHALTLTGAVAVNFTVMKSFAMIYYTPALAAAWLSFSLAMSAVFVAGSTVLESLLISGSISLSVASGDSPQNAAATLNNITEQHRTEGSNGVMWYQQSVIRPLADGAVEQILDTRGGPTPDKLQRVANFEMLYKYVECFNTAVSFMAAFAWCNSLSMYLCGKPAELAPPVDHAYVFAGILSIIAPVVDVALIQLHTLIAKTFGV